MNKDTSEISDLIKALPKNLRSAVASVDLNVALQLIGNNHDLLISETGSLYEEVKKMLLGEIRPEQFRSNLIKGFYENTDKVDEVIKEVNELVLNPIRRNLEAGDTEEEEDHSNLERSDILQGIENPVAASHPKMEAQPAPKPMVNPIHDLEIAPADPLPATIPGKMPTSAPTLPRTAPIAPKSSPSQMLEDKMSGMVKMPKQEVTIGPSKDITSKLPPLSNRTAGTDPYREAIN